MRRRLAITLFALLAAGCAGAARGELRYEVVKLEKGDPTVTLHLLYRTETVPRHPVILMLGSLERDKPPEWSVDLVGEGYMLAAFSAAHPPDPDPKRRPQWLVFDERFAHSYVLAGARAPVDAGRVIDYLVARSDVHAEKIGWIGSSSTGIPGLAAATREKRIAAVVAFVSTGAYALWLETWRTNGLWRGKGPDIWPETRTLLEEHDPMLRASALYPCAVLMVNGGEDKVVDARTARAFVEAARPSYASDPDRLRLVVYEGFGHNLPADVVKLYAEHWFHLYLHPTRSPPAAPSPPAGLDESVKRTQINAGDHREVLGGTK